MKSQQKPRILVADDDPNSIALLVRALKREGYALETANDGPQALSAILANPPDLVLLDVMMPGMDGYQVLREVRRFPGLVRLPIILVTGVDPQSKVYGLEAGADDFLTKPVDLAELRARTRNLLRLKLAHDSLSAAYEELARLDKLRRDLMAMLVHDLKTPLGGLIGMVELGCQEAEQRGLEQLAEDMKVAAHSGRKLNSMILDLLDIARMEEGKLKLHLAPCDLGPLVEEAFSACRFMADERHISLREEVPADLPQPPIDKRLMGRVFTNLVANAIKHSRQEGEVVVKACVRPLATGRELLVSVEDQGEGIPPEYVGRVFEKFVEVERKQLGLPADTGLGLTFSRLAVDAHEGAIWAESELGKGSKFCFTLPLSQEVRS